MMRKARAARSEEKAQAQGTPDIVYRELRELIVSGRLAPGTRLVETFAAKRLGVSRTPVRSAFHRLKREGYAVAANEDDERQRLIVAPITAGDAADLFHIVGELEGLAGFYSAGIEEGRRTLFTRELEKINNEMLVESQASKMDNYKVFQLDAAFHRRYVEEAAPPRLLALHDAIKPQAERYARIYVSALTDKIDLSVAEHALIISAIEKGEQETTQRAIQTNWRNAAHRVGELIAEWGESGGW